MRAGRGATRGEGWAAGREAGPVRVSAWERVGLLASGPGEGSWVEGVGRVLGKGEEYMGLSCWFAELRGPSG